MPRPGPHYVRQNQLEHGRLTEKVRDGSHRACTRASVRVRRLIVVLTAGLVLALTPAGSALAASWAGHDPAANDTPTVPESCWIDRTGADCQTAALAALDQSRANLGQPAYALPANFSSLTSNQQAFVLTGLDRVLYGLPAVAGITKRLSADALGGVLSDADPHASDPNLWGWTANWAGGFPNVLYAYQGWMYDDGPGSDNLDCTPTSMSGCWGHRHDILWEFNSVGFLSAGVASAADGAGVPGYALLLALAAPGVTAPTYTYTWAQAVTAGANHGKLGPAAPTSDPTSPPIPTPPSRPPARSASAGAPVAHHALGVTVSPIDRSRRTVRFTARITKGHGAITAVAVRGRRRVRLTVSRAGAAFRFHATLAPGTWTLTIAATGSGTWTAPTALTIRIR